MIFLFLFFFVVDGHDMARNAVALAQARRNVLSKNSNN